MLFPVLTDLMSRFWWIVEDFEHQMIVRIRKGVEVPQNDSSQDVRFKFRFALNDVLIVGNIQNRDRLKPTSHLGTLSLDWGHWGLSKRNNCRWSREWWRLFRFDDLRRSLTVCVSRFSLSILVDEIGVASLSVLSAFSSLIWLESKLVVLVFKVAWQLFRFKQLTTVVYRLFLSRKNERLLLVCWFWCCFHTFRFVFFVYLIIVRLCCFIFN